MAGTRTLQGIGKSRTAKAGTGTAGTWSSTGTTGTREGTLGVHTRPQGEVGAGGGGGLAQPLEVAQVLEDEDEGGPAEDDPAEGAALQQPRQERPQALGQPRAPRHVPNPAGHRPGLSPAWGASSEPAGDKGRVSHPAGTRGDIWGAQGHHGPRSAPRPWHRGHRAGPAAHTDVCRHTEIYRCGRAVPGVHTHVCKHTLTFLGVHTHL